MAYQIAGEGTVGYQSISEISTTKKHELGSEVVIVDKNNGWSGKAMYVAFPASAAVAAGQLVTQVAPAAATSIPFRVTPTVQATHKFLGVPVYVNLTTVTSVASVQYGWVLTSGVAPTLKDAVKIAATDKLTLSTSNAGRVQLASVAGAQILGVRLAASSITTTTSLVNIYYDRAATQTKVT